MILLASLGSSAPLMEVRREKMVGGEERQHKEVWQYLWL
jgi:hypothetical protein